MKVTIPTRPRSRIEILPLIDIVFLLLVFFIYAMLSMAVHRGVPVDLPLSSETAMPEKQDLAHKIDKILSENRTTLASISAVTEKAPDRKTEKLAGFGEKIKTRILGLKGMETDVEYKFNRYKPHICVKARDGK